MAFFTAKTGDELEGQLQAWHASQRRRDEAIAAAWRDYEATAAPLAEAKAHMRTPRATTTAAKPTATAAPPPPRRLGAAEAAALPPAPPNPTRGGADGGDGATAARAAAARDLDRIGDDALRDCHELDDAAFAATLAATRHRGANGARRGARRGERGARGHRAEDGGARRLMAAGAPWRARRAQQGAQAPRAAGPSPRVRRRRLEGAAGDDDEPSPAKSASSASTGAELTYETGRDYGFEKKIHGLLYANQRRDLGERLRRPPPLHSSRRRAAAPRGAPLGGSAARSWRSRRRPGRFGRGRAGARGRRAPVLSVKTACLRGDADQCATICGVEGFNVDALIEGAPPLHHAARAGSEAVVRALAACGASLDATDGKGNRALHVACERGHPEAAEALLGLGASDASRPGQQKGRAKPKAHLKVDGTVSKLHRQLSAATPKWDERKGSVARARSRGGDRGAKKAADPIWGASPRRRRRRRIAAEEGQGRRPHLGPDPETPATPGSRPKKAKAADPIWGPTGDAGDAGSRPKKAKAVPAPPDDEPDNPLFGRGPSLKDALRTSEPSPAKQSLPKAFQTVPVPPRTPDFSPVRVNVRTSNVSSLIAMLAEDGGDDDGGGDEDDDCEDDYEDDEEFLRGVPGLPPPPRTPPTVAGVPMPSGFAGGF
ncbi:hypothetical protein JL720_5936 [Aureococcus anophagefferens]|nr:hypothetical protein JL720_5936 [Aureococcus anophagefferens]